MTATPIERVVFCCNCECCFALGPRACPACASPHIISLALWVNRLAPVLR